MFFCNDTATTEIYTLSLHDALPISTHAGALSGRKTRAQVKSGSFLRRSCSRSPGHATIDRKSTRLNSSHANISYAVFCLKKKIYLLFLSSLFLVISSFFDPSDVHHI